MRNHLLICLSFTALIACNSSTEMTRKPYEWPDAKAPIAEKKEHLRIIDHGHFGIVRLV